MIRSASLCFFSLLASLVAACGGNIAHDTSDSTAGSSSSGGNTGESGSTRATKGAAQSFDGGVTCSTPPPSPTAPTDGCAENMGSGWVSVPCSCELWLRNAAPASVAAGIQLTVETPPDQPPSPAGTGAVEVVFDDADASWYATWTKHAGNGDAFTVTHDGGTTTVSAGEGGITLLPVPLGACATRKAHAKVTGAATLSMQAVLANGKPLAAMTSCNNPAAHPPPGP